MDLKGLTINFLGDSITEGKGVLIPENRFVDRIAASAGCTCRNYGVGGTRIARQSKASNPTRYDLDYNARLLCVDHDADLIVVFGGTNDFGHGDAPLGTMDDKSVYTFYGAVQSLFNDLKMHYSNDQIIILTPLHRFRSEEESREPHLDEYVGIIRDLAREYQFHVLDLYEKSKIHPRLENVREMLVPDGLHPNDEGHAILAKEIIDFLCAL